jgi:hypothetical protein
LDFTDRTYRCTDNPAIKEITHALLDAELLYSSAGEPSLGFNATSYPKYPGSGLTKNVDNISLQACLALIPFLNIQALPLLFEIIPCNDEVIENMSAMERTPVKLMLLTILSEIIFPVYYQDGPQYHLELR